MLYTVNYTKKNSFMREPRLKQRNLEGELVSDSRYVKPTIPKAVRVYVPHIHYKKNSFMISMEQAELDKLVELIGFYDENNNVIKSAPLKNPNAPFWKHPELKINLNGSGLTLDDENPMDKFWLKCFEADPRFRFTGEDLPPSIASRVQYSVTKVSEQLNEQSETNDEMYKAMKLLTVNEDDHEKLASILRAMGTDVQNPNPKLVRDALLRKITDYKDQYVQGRNERNIEMFIRLATSTTEALTIQDTIAVARKKNLIKKGASGTYIYGEVKLGTSLEMVEESLKKEENAEIYRELIEKTKK